MASIVESKHRGRELTKKRVRRSVIERKVNGALFRDAGWEYRVRGDILGRYSGPVGRKVGNYNAKRLNNATNASIDRAYAALHFHDAVSRWPRFLFPPPPPLLKLSRLSADRTFIAAYRLSAIDRNWMIPLLGTLMPSSMPARSTTMKLNSVTDSLSLFFPSLFSILPRSNRSPIVSTLLNQIERHFYSIRTLLKFMPSSAISKINNASKWKNSSLLVARKERFPTDGGSTRSMIGDVSKIYRTYTYIYIFEDKKRERERGICGNSI